MSLFKILKLSMRKNWVLPLAVLMSVILLAGCAPAMAAVVSRSPGYTEAAGNLTQAAPLFDEGTVTSLYDRCIPAVVQIESEKTSALSKLPAPFNQSVPKQLGAGSGFFIDDQGHILTNNHVVEDTSTIRVLLYDGTQLDCKVLGTDRANDVTLLQVDASKLSNITYFTLADSSKVKPGQMAIALGSPYGLQGSITVGVVSGTGRAIPGSTDRTMTGIIQTDAAINPGNSGGPLLNSSGEVIGINTAIEASANGVGFAVPINTVKTRLPELLKGGTVKSPWLGISGLAASKELAGKLKLKSEKGVYIVTILAGSPADKAGLVAGGKNELNEPKEGGDLVMAIDDTKVTSVEDLLTFLNGKTAGDKVTLTVERGGQTISVPVELEAWPDKLPGQEEIDIIPDQDGNKFDFGPFHFYFK